MSRKPLTPGVSLPPRRARNEPRPEHYIPPKALNADEEARRKRFLPGTLILEQQHAGITIAARILEELQHDADAWSDTTTNISFPVLTLSAGALATAWYNLPDSQQGNLGLVPPRLTPRNADSYDIFQRATRAFRGAVKPAAAIVTTAHTLQRPRRHKGPWTPNHLDDKQWEKFQLLQSRKAELGKRLGNAGLLLGAVMVGDTIVTNRLSTGDAFDVVNEQCGVVNDNVNALNEKLRQPPSLAQLADPHSAFSRYWYQYAPDRAYEIYATVAANPEA